MGASVADGGALLPTAIGAAYCKGEMCAGVNAGLVAGGSDAEAYLGVLASGGVTCGGVCSGHPWYLALLASAAALICNKWWISCCICTYLSLAWRAVWSAFTFSCLSCSFSDRLSCVKVSLSLSKSANLRNRSLREVAGITG